MPSSRRPFGAVVASATVGGVLGASESRPRLMPPFVAPFMANDHIIQTYVCLLGTMLVSCLITLAAKGSLARGGVVAQANDEVSGG